MQRLRALGASGLQVSPLCLGGNVFGWSADEDASFAVLDAFADAGGNFIDTANIYSGWIPGNQGGESEAIIGRWLAGRPDRDRFVVATKVGMAGGRFPKGLTRDHIRAGIDGSLERLGLDRVPLYFAHEDDPATPLAETMAAFDELVREGLVGAVGASNYDAVRLAEALGAPVLTTFKGKGLIPDAHPLAGGVLGRSGTPVASWLMNEADLLVVLGASFADHTGISPYKPAIQVDRNPLALGRFQAVTVPVLGDIGVTARLLAEAPGAAGDDQRADVADRWAIWRAEKARRLADDRGRGVSSAAIFAALTRHAPEDAVIAVDVGNNTYSFGRYFECGRQTILMSGYLGSIGFGFPAAMGAWAAVQADGSGRRVLAVTGDGGFGQYLAELTTAVRHDMDITHVLLNNSQLGKISKEQRAGRWDVWQTTLHNPPFAEYAQLCGAWGRRVTDARDLDDAIAAALDQRGPSLVEVISDPDLV